MADPLRSRSINIGGADRSMKFTFAAFRVAKRALAPVSLQVAVENLDPPTVCDLAAAGFFGGGDARVTPDIVGSWIENEPEKFVELAMCVSDCVVDAYARLKPPTPAGGAVPAKQPATTPGMDGQISTDSSTSSDASG